MSTFLKQASQPLSKPLTVNAYSTQSLQGTCIFLDMYYLLPITKGRRSRKNSVCARLHDLSIMSVVTQYLNINFW